MEQVEALNALFEIPPKERKATIARAANSLLHVSFSEALELSSKLTEHIKKQSDPEGVEQEFREAWDGDISQLLLSVLSEVLAKEEDSVILSIIFSAPSPLCEPMEDVPALPKSLYSSSPWPADATEEEGRADRLRRVMNAPEYGTIEMGGWLPGEMAAPPSATVDDLLRVSFGEALFLSEELRIYLSDLEDGQVVEAEFRESWGPDAPESLRSVLEQVLSTGHLKLLEDTAETSLDDSEMVQPTWLGTDFLSPPGMAKFARQLQSKL
jgi:hypothetical protein